MKTYINVLGFRSKRDREKAENIPGDDLIETKNPPLRHYRKTSNSLELETTVDQIRRLGCKDVGFEVVEIDQKSDEGVEAVLFRTQSLEEVYEFLKRHWKQGRVALFYFTSESMKALVARELPKVDCKNLPQVLKEFKYNRWPHNHVVVGSLREYTHGTQNHPIILAVGLPEDNLPVQILETEREILNWISEGDR